LAESKKMNTKLQINISSELHPETLKVLKYNVLTNVASNSATEIAELCAELRAAMGSEVIVGRLPQANIAAPARLPAPAIQQQEPELGKCPFCQTNLRRFVCKKYGSKNYGKTYECCPMHRLTGCSYIKEIVGVS
jgi:hypothetical protein